MAKPTIYEIALNPDGTTTNKCVELKPYPMTADQQIRAKALECGVRLYADHPREVGIDPEQFMERFERVFWADVLRFEAYIRNGKEN